MAQHRSFFRLYADLTKFGIVIFVLLSGLAGYATSYILDLPFSVSHFFNLVLGLYFLSSGSLALNQWQEIELDRKMKRTAGRPMASGAITPAAGLIFSIAFLAVGLNQLGEASSEAFWCGFATVVLYNGLYTPFLKKISWTAALVGAIPGALPVTVGYAANRSDLLSLESIYLFLILFFWQMPHFWMLALKFQRDYQAGGVPVLPVAKGVKPTLDQSAVYLLAYLLTALSLPLFFPSSWMYLIVIFPFAAKLLADFFRYYRSRGEARWLSTFLWLNVSVLVFLFVPVIDRWSFFWLH